MSDRCYAFLTCRPEHEDVFSVMGFRAQSFCDPRIGPILKNGERIPPLSSGDKRARDLTSGKRTVTPLPSTAGHAGIDARGDYVRRSERSGRGTENRTGDTTIRSDPGCSRIHAGEDVTAVHMVDDRADSGHFSELMELSGRGIPFYGGHFSGDDYGSFVFACDGDRVVFCETLFGDGDPAVAVHEGGRIEPADLENAFAYWRILAAALKKIGGAP